MNAESIAQSLGGGTRKGKSWAVRAVCHSGDDRNLNIWDGDDGGIGARCHSRACDYATIMYALGVYTPHVPGRTDTLIAVYQNVDGKPREVHRADFAPGECRFKDCDKKHKHGDACPPCEQLDRQHKHIWGYGSPTGCYVLLWNDQPEATVIWCEGEKAAASLQARGYTAATTRGGSKSVSQSIYTPLSGRDVIIWPDNDGDGALAAVEIADMCERTGAKSIRYVLPPHDVSDGWDAADATDDEISNLLRSSYDVQDAHERLKQRFSDAFSAKTQGAQENSPGSEPAQPSRISIDTREARTAFEIACAQLGLRFRYNTRANRPEVYEDDARQVIGMFHELRKTPDGWGVVSQNEIHAIARYMRLHYEIIRSVKNDDVTYKPLDISKTMMNDYIGELAQTHYADPFISWLRELPAWDGVQRIETYLTDALHADDTPATREASSKMFLGAVKRAHLPGSEHRWMPVLIGDQDVGKSLSARTLFPDEWQDEWFTDAPTLGISTKEMIEQVGGAVIVEYSELAGMRRADVEKVKAQLSRRNDTARLAYDRANTFKQRAYIAVGTSNDDGQGVLPDSPSGNTRFVPIFVRPVATELLDWMFQWRQQYWAEALALFDADNHLPTWLSSETSEERAALAEQYTAVDVVADAIANAFDATHVQPLISDDAGLWYDTPSIIVASGLALARAGKERGAFGATHRDIDRELAVARTDRSLQTAVGKALTKLRWRKKQAKMGRSRPRVYLRPNDTQQAEQEVMPWA